MNWPHAYIMPENATPSQMRTVFSGVRLRLDNVAYFAGVRPRCHLINPSARCAGPTRAKSVSAWFMVESARLLLEPSMIRKSRVRN